MNTINNIPSKICVQCKSRVSNDEVLVSVWKFGIITVLNCTNCQIVKAVTKKE